MATHSNTGITHLRRGPCEESKAIMQMGMRRTPWTAIFHRRGSQKRKTTQRVTRRINICKMFLIIVAQTVIKGVRFSGGMEEHQLPGKEMQSGNVHFESKKRDREHLRF